MNSGVSAAEKAWLLGACVLILLLSSLPVLAGYAAQDAGAIFSGAVYDRQDYAVHLASMHLGSRGELSYSLRFTHEAHPSYPIKLGYVVLGWAGGGLGLQPSITYELARLAGGACLILAIYMLAARAFPGSGMRRMALLLAMLGSGLGWLQLILGWVPQHSTSPVDFWLIDLYPFFGIMTLPHFSLIAAILVGMMLAAVAALARRAFLMWLLAAVGSLAVIFISPSFVLIGDVACAAVMASDYLRTRKRRGLHVGFLTGLALIQAPFLIWQTRILGQHPVWAGFAAQNITLSPPPLYYDLGLGLLGPLAIWGAWIAFRRANLIGMASTLWMGLSLALSYLPTAIQRRFSFGLMIPVGLLAVFALAYGLLPRVRLTLLRRSKGVLAEKLRARRGSILVIFLLLSSLSSLYLAAGGALYASNRAPTIFDPPALVAAMDWLSAEADADDVVFGSARTGLLIPPRSGLRAYVGHPIETLAFEAKMDAVVQFFGNGAMTDAERLHMLRTCACKWLIFGPYEKEISPADFNQTFLAGLHPVFRLGETRVYRLTQLEDSP